MRRKVDSTSATTPRGGAGQSLDRGGTAGPSIKASTPDPEVTDDLPEFAAVLDCAKEVPSTFNARAESVAEKPMFRDAFIRARCVVPASGYYEWKPTPSGKQPYYLSARDGSVLSFAGLWDEWHDIETGEIVKSCTIIVTAANDFTRRVHDRMPVVLEQFEPWLTGAANAEVPKPAPEVNWVGNDNDPTLINAIQ